MAVIQWLQENWLNIAAIYAGLVTVASIIVKMTPTLKDDTALLKVIKFIAKYVALARTVNDAAIRGQLPPQN
jgi:predicted nucleic acid-binding protein